ncbi:MAG: helix-turn-helix domain-containing protein [Candidatus Berkiella sp.]
MIHRALKTIRLFHNRTQADLAKELDISKSYLSEIESGNKSVAFSLLEKYSEIFDIPVSSLVFFSESIDKDDSLPEKFRSMAADKILKIMEWVALRDEAKKMQS